MDTCSKYDVAAVHEDAAKALCTVPKEIAFMEEFLVGRVLCHLPAADLTSA